MNKSWNNRYQLFFENFYLESRKFNVCSDLGIITYKDVSDFVTIIVNNYLKLDDDCFFLIEFNKCKETNTTHLIGGLFIENSDINKFKVLYRYSSIIKYLTANDYEISIFRQYKGVLYISQASINKILREVTDLDIEKALKIMKSIKSIFKYLVDTYKNCIRGTIIHNRILINNKLQNGNLKKLKAFFNNFNIIYFGKSTEKEFSLYKINNFDNLDALSKVS